MREILIPQEPVAYGAQHAARTNDIFDRRSLNPASRLPAVCQRAIRRHRAKVVAPLGVGHLQGLKIASRVNC